MVEDRVPHENCSFKKLNRNSRYYHKMRAEIIFNLVRDKKSRVVSQVLSLWQTNRKKILSKQ